MSGFALAVAIEVLLLLAFLTLDFRDRPKPRVQGRIDLDLRPRRPARKQAPKSEQQASRDPDAKVPHPELPAVKPQIMLPERPLDSCR